MADELDKYLGSITGQALSTGPAPVTSGAGTDELGLYLDGLHKGGGLPETVNMPGAPDPTGAPVKSSEEEEALAQLDLMMPKKGYFETLGGLYSGGVKRNLAQFQAMPDMVGALYNKYQGNDELAVEQARKAIAIEGSAGKPEYDLTKVHDLEDFSYWLTEKLGENAATTAAMAFTGVAGALLTKGGMMVAGSMAPTVTKSMVEKGLITEGTRRAALMTGAAVPTYALTTGLETSGTGSEIFEATGKLAPELALGAGMAKGALELWAPMSLAKSIISPSMVLGKTLPGAITKMMLKEGSTELAQEAIDITARKHMDPTYNFFDSGTEDWLSLKHPGVLRLTEAGLAGSLVGGVYGAPFAKREQDAKTQKPGDRTVLPGDPAARGDADYINKIAGAIAEPEPAAPTMQQLSLPEMEKGPVTTLREMVFPPGKDKDIYVSTMAGRPADDLMGVGPLLRSDGMPSPADKILDLVDKTTPRYVVKRPDGKFDFEVMTDTEAELHNVTNYAQSEKPDYHRVDVGSLSAAGISARLTNLTQDVWFLPGVTPQEQAELRSKYQDLFEDVNGNAAQALWSKAGARALEETFRGPYQELLNRGLRVVPTRGAGFYYSGVMKAERTELSTTGRDRRVGLYNPDSNTFSTLRENLGYNVWGDDGKAQYASTGLIDDVLPGMIPISLDMNRLPKDSFVEHSDGSISFKSRLDLTKVTPGVDLGVVLAQEDADFAKAVSDTIPEKGLVKTEVFNRFPREDMTARAFEIVLKKLAPKVDEILRSIGADFSMQIQVRPRAGNPSPGWVHLNGGIIGFNPDVWAEGVRNSSGNLELDIAEVLFHEVGHMVTLYYWQRLPLEQQGQLIYAWEKANLARRMDAPDWKEKVGDLRAMNPFINMPQSSYYLGFLEWLAEQFRRWAASDPQTVNLRDGALKGGATLLDKYYAEWEKNVGFQQARNLREPDYYFTAFMEYLKSFGRDKRELREKWAQQEVYFFDDALLDSPPTVAIVKQVDLALQSMLQMFPPEVSALIQERIEPVIGDHGFQTRAQAVFDHPSGIPRIELALAALGKTNVFGETRVSITHELMHVFERMGLLTEDEIKIIDAAIAKGPDPLGTSAGAYRLSIKAKFEDYFKGQALEDNINKLLQEERRAFYLQEFANTGISNNQEVSTIFTRLLEVLERVKNFIMGLGYTSRDDVIRAIFRGEVAQRATQMTAGEIRAALRSGTQIESMQQLNLDEYLFDKVEQTGKYTVGVAYDGGDPSSLEGKQRSKYISYIFFHPDGKQAGYVDLKNKMPKGFEIEMIETKKGDGFSGMAFTNYVEQDLGIPMKLAGILLEDGFQQGKLFARKRAGIKDLETYYQPVQRKDGTVQYYSPNKTREMVGLWTRIVGMMQTPEGVRTVNEQFADVLKAMVQPGATSVKLEERMTQKRAIAILASWKAFEKRFPPQVWTSPKLDYMFQLQKNSKMDGIQGASTRHSMDEVGAELLTAMDGPQPATGMTARQMYEAKMERYKAATAAEMGWRPRDVGAPLVPTMQMLGSFKNAWRGVEGAYHSVAGTHPERLNKHLAGQIKIMDRMNAFWKWTLTIKQLAQKNPHIAGLKDYVNNNELMGQITMRWTRRAEETARKWEGIGAKQREAVSKMMFDLTEMRYRSSAEVQSKVIRNPRGWPDFLAGKPPQLEVLSMLLASGIEKKNWPLIRQIAVDFQDFLAEVERVRAEEAAKTFAKNPAGLQAAMAKLATEMGEMRAKPYFPMMRFGQFTIAVRDGTSGKIIWATAFDNQAQRDAAVEQVRRQFPGDDITIGRASEAAAEFMGLPGPLLRLIREKMNSDPSTQLTAEQEAFLEEFEMINGPDTTFAKRWMPSQGMPGYSMDGFRAYAHYFQSGARYIARLQKMDDLKASILAVENDIRRGGLSNTAKRQMIADYMKAHYRYIMEPGEDSGKLRAFVSLWYLGFSVPAAFMNLSQVPLVTYPLLVKHFGVKTFPEFNLALNAWKNTYRLRADKQGVGSPSYIRAREEAIRQGIIDVGQAAELGGFAEGYNLHKLLAGDKTQRAWRNISWAGMYMFGYVEQVNREFTFNVSYNLALKNPNAKRVTEIDTTYGPQVVELQARTGMTWNEAVAFLFAKELVDRSQYSYDKSADPQFMRGKKKDLLIFFKFMQNTLFTMTHNGGSTMAHMLLLYMAVYGLQGLPGSEDLNELIRLLAKKLGFDVDFHQEARKMVREITRGSIFDKTGPDLFMHGISRYGLGPALFTEHYWPQFDVSANGSMGRIIPGMAELFHGMATNKKMADVFAESAQKASGAAYGMVFPLMKYLMEPPGTADSKKWEALLPRFAKGYVKAYRHGWDPGAETDSTGAKLVKFDITDIGDLQTVLFTALGFQPRKVNEVYEMLRESRDAQDIMQARRVALYAQLDKAIRVNDVQVIIDVTSAMTRYNKEVIEAGYPTMALKTQQIIQSLKQRSTGRAMQENFLARNRSQVPVTQKMMDLWPGIEPRNVK